MIRAVGGPVVLLAGGGTGGHLFPGIAVAEALTTRVPGSRALLAATERDVHGLHGARCPIEIKLLGSPRLPRGAVGLPGFGARMAQAIARSRTLLRRERPDVVIGLGGYGSVAPVIAARWLGIPVVLLEQNAVPGLATRVLSRFASVTAASFEGAAPRGVRGRIVVTGNPIRRDVLATRSAHGEWSFDRRVPVLAVLGGSLGARGVDDAFNRAVALLIVALRGSSDGRPNGDTLQVVHATGCPDRAADQRARYERLGIPAIVQPFFDDMGAVYGTADVVLARAGGTTVAELAAVGLPGVLIPYPHHADDHQRANAGALSSIGAVDVLDESSARPDALERLLLPLLADTEERSRRSRLARVVGRPEAADRVVDLVIELSRPAVESASLRQATLHAAGAPEGAAARSGVGALADVAGLVDVRGAVVPAVSPVPPMREPLQ